MPFDIYSHVCIFSVINRKGEFKKKEKLQLGRDETARRDAARRSRPNVIYTVIVLYKLEDVRVGSTFSGVGVSHDFPIECVLIVCTTRYYSGEGHSRIMHDLIRKLMKREIKMSATLWGTIHLLPSVFTTVNGDNFKTQFK